MKNNQRITHTLMEISNLLITPGLKVEDILKLILKKAAALTGAKAASVMVLIKGKTLAFMVAIGEKARLLKNIRINLGEGVAGTVALDGIPRIVNNPYESPLFSPRIDKLTGFKTENLLAVPLKSRKRILGTLEALNKKGGFTEKDMEILSSIASQAAKVLETFLLYRKLSTLKEYYEAIIYSNLNAIIVLDSNGKVKIFNPSAERIFGIQAKSVLGKKLATFPDFNPLAEMMMEVIKTGEPIWHKEIKWKNKHLAIRIFPLFYKKHRRSAAASIEDITRIKELEERVKKAERLKALGEMASHVAHEIRNPLTAIRGFIELIEKQLSPVKEKDLHSLVPMVLNELDRLANLATDLSSLKKSHLLQLKEIFLNKELEQMLNLYRPLLKEKNIDTEFIPCKEEIKINVDPEKFRQVLTNLLKNAQEAMPNGGKITIKMDTFKREDGAFVRISISDTGPGIPKEIVEKIFAPFFTTKPGGTGLGLSIAHEIMRAHGGWIEAQNRESGGAEFHLVLPLQNTK